MVAAGQRRPSGPSVRKAVSGVDGSESHKNHMQLLWSSPGNEHLRLWKVHAASDVWKTFRMSVRQANFLLIRGRVDKFWHERVVSRKFRDDPWIRCSFRHLGRPLCTRGMFSSSVHQGSAGKNIINRRKSYHNRPAAASLGGTIVQRHFLETLTSCGNAGMRNQRNYPSRPGRVSGSLEPPPPPPCFNSYDCFHAVTEMGEHHFSAREK